MANQEDRYENEGIDMDLSGMGSVLHGGSAVQQGMRGYSRRTEERGRNEFHGHGGSAELDPGRIHEGGRHYGRPAVAEPAPDGGPPGRPDLGEMRDIQAAQLQVIEADAMGPVALTPPSMLQTRHGEAKFTNDRVEVEPKPPAIADRPRHDVPSRVEEPEPTALDAASPAAAPTRKATARATPQTARKAATRTGTKAAVRGTARSELTTRETSKASAKASAVKTPTAKASAVKTPTAKTGTAKKAPAKASVAKKATAKKATTKAGTAKKAPAKASAAKKATAKKATAKKTVR